MRLPFLFLEDYYMGKHTKEVQKKSISNGYF